MEIIKLSERGETSSVIGKVLGYCQAMIGTILNSKVRIMEHQKCPALMKATVINKQQVI